MGWCRTIKFGKQTFWTQWRNLTEIWYYFWGGRFHGDRDLNNKLEEMWLQDVTKILYFKASKVKAKKQNKKNKKKQNKQNKKTTTPKLKQKTLPKQNKIT